MEMTDRQIASEYRTGKDRTKTIKTLAELNLCSQRRIAEILQVQGEELPKAWRDKLSLPLKRPPRDKPAAPREINDPVLVEAADNPAEAFRQEPAVLLPVPAPATLSLDEIRQAALQLILNNSPGEPVRFQGYALGVAALVEALQEKLEAKA